MTRGRSRTRCNAVTLRLGYRFGILSGRGCSTRTNWGSRPLKNGLGDFYTTAGVGLSPFSSPSGAPSGEFTQMAFEVTDLKATVAAMRARGVIFEEYDLPGLKTVDGIAEVDGNYPSKGGVGELAAWFKDSEGNLLGIGQPLR